MVSCDICGKEFKNTQGLRGHKNFIHSNMASNIRQPATRQLLSSKAEEQPSKLHQLETKYQLLESKLELLESKLEQVTSIAQQANELAETVQLKESEVPSHTHSHLHSHSKHGYDSEHRELLEQVDERINKQLEERLGGLKNEVVNKIDQIEIRLRKLEPVTCSPSKKPLGTCTRIRR